MSDRRRENSMRYMGALQAGDPCPRCGGTGRVYGEVFEYEWTDCPFFDVERGIACSRGRIVGIEQIQGEGSTE